MAFYICMKLECIGWVQITAFGFELWENLVLYCAVSHCRCPGLPATLNGRQQGWIVIGWPEAPLLGGCGVAVFGHGHSQKQTIYPLLRGATEKSWKISRREATKAFSLQHNANSCHACSLPNPRHKDTIHSYANTYSLETLLQSIEVKNIPVNYKWQLKHDFTFFSTLIGSTACSCSCCFQNALQTLRLKQNIWNIYRNAEHPHGKVQVYSSRM